MSFSTKLNSAEIKDLKTAWRKLRYSYEFEYNVPKSNHASYTFIDGKPKIYTEDLRRIFNGLNINFGYSQDGNSFVTSFQISRLAYDKMLDFDLASLGNNNEIKKPQSIVIPTKNPEPALTKDIEKPISEEAKNLLKLIKNPIVICNNDKFGTRIMLGHEFILSEVKAFQRNFSEWNITEIVKKNTSRNVKTEVTYSLYANKPEALDALTAEGIINGKSRTL